MEAARSRRFDGPGLMGRGRKVRVRPSMDWGIVAVAMLGIVAVGVGVLDLSWPAALGLAVASILLDGLVAAVFDE